MDPVQTVAVLGTGTMGAPMAANMARAGLAVRAWNRTRSKAEPLADEGVTVCDTPAEAAQGARAVVTVLFDTDAVAAAVPGALDAAGPGTVWIQAATVGVDGCRRLADLAAEHGAVYVDAPVLGTRKPAEDAQLVVLASGPEEATEACRPVFDAIGRMPRWLGPAGAGSRLKLVVNSWVLAVNSGTAAAVALAEGFGLDPQLFFDTIEGGPLDCRYAHLKGAAILARQLAPSFTLTGAAKDTSLILAGARDAGATLGMAEGILSDLQRAVDSGHGSEDMAAVYFAYRNGRS